MIKRSPASSRRASAPFTSEAAYKLSILSAAIGVSWLVAADARAQAAPTPPSAASAPADAASAVEAPSLGAVTIRRQPRLQKLQDKPAAEAMATGVDLDRDLARDYNAITKRLPGITFNQSNARGAKTGNSAHAIFTGFTDAKGVQHAPARGLAIEISTTPTTTCRPPPGSARTSSTRRRASSSARDGEECLRRRHARTRLAQLRPTPYRRWIGFSVSSRI